MALKSLERWNLLPEQEVIDFIEKAHANGASDGVIRRTLDERQRERRDDPRRLTPDEHNAIACVKILTKKPHGAVRMSAHVVAEQVRLNVIWDYLAEQREAYPERYRQEAPIASPEEVARLRQLPYREYLQSEHWERTRRACYAAADNRCQLCYSEGEIHAHHRTYERRGCELPSDVIALCDPCHAKFHDKLPKAPR